VDHVEREVAATHPLDHRLDLGAVAIHAARHPDPQGPARQDRGATGERRVAGEDLARRAEEDEVVHLRRRDREREGDRRARADVHHRALGTVDEAAVASAREPEGDRLVGEVRRVEADRVAAPEDPAATALVEPGVGLAESHDCLVGQQLERLVHAGGAVGVAPCPSRRRHPVDEGPVEDLPRQADRSVGLRHGEPERLGADAYPQSGRREPDALVVGDPVDGEWLGRRGEQHR
jgi:hypothetical protein